MKARKQKVIRIGCIIVSIFLLASFFALPVMAEVDNLSSVEVENDIYFSVGSDEEVSSQRPYTPFYVGYFTKNQLTGYDDLTSAYWSWTQATDGMMNSNGGYFDFWDAPVNQSGRTLKAVYYINQLFDDYAVRTFREGDTMFIGAEGWLGTWFDTITEFVDYRFTLRDNGDDYMFSFGRIVAYTDTVTLDNETVEDDAGFDYPGLVFKFNQEVTSSTLCLCLEFTITNEVTDLVFNIDPVNILIKFGSGVSPNYPIFPAAPGGDDVGNYDKAEQQLVQSQQQGLSQGAQAIQGAGSSLNALSNDLKLMSFVPVLSGMLDRIVQIPGINALVNISLSLGLFVSLLGLAASIVSAADRKVGQAKREAKTEEVRQAKLDYYRSRTRK